MSRQFLTRLFRTISVLMVLVAVALFAAITTMHFAIHGAEVQVPAFKGMTVADARSQAAGMGLNLDVDNRYYSGDVAAGHILSQSPASGTVVRREWRVRVAESLGPQKVDVPETVGKEQRLAALELRRAGLDVGTVAHLPLDGSSEGKVLAQDPPAHAQGIERPSVNLLLAAPQDASADGFVMPDFSGVPIVAAQAELTSIGIQSATPTFISVPIPPVGATGAPPAPLTAPGSVIGQQPPAGARVDQATVVHFSVAK
jgi:beta-lactam-binding protein with PASTA domain